MLRTILGFAILLAAVPLYADETISERATEIRDDSAKHGKKAARKAKRSAKQTEQEASDRVEDAKDEAADKADDTEKKLD